MLQLFRDKLQGYIIWLIVSLIILVFILGAGSYLFNRGYNNTIAKVNGESISSDLVNQRYQSIVSQYYSKKNRHSFEINPKKLKQQILDELIKQISIITGLEKRGFSVLNEQLLDIIKRNPMVQVNGKFSQKKYTDWLNNLRISELEYQKFLTQQILSEQLTNILPYANFIPKEEIENFLLKWFQTRKVGYLVVPKSKFPQPVVSEKDIADYYVNNQKNLLTPETVKIKYLELSANKLMENINPTREELHKYYKEHQEYYTLPELVKIRHILINSKSDTSKEDKQANLEIDVAKNKITEILNKLQSGASFKELAEKFSEDRGSKTNEGNLGWIGKGDIDPEFDNAAFSLKKAGDISNIVKTKFGYHIIQLIDKRDATISKFEDALDKVTKHFKEESVQNKIQELYTQLSEHKNKGIDLEKIAEDLKLNLNFTDNFTVGGGSDGVTSYPILVAAAFEQKNSTHNSDIIRLEEDHFVLFKVIDYKPEKTKELKEASEEIKKILQEQQIKLKAEEYNKKLIQELMSAKDPIKLAKNYDLEWKTANIQRNTHAVMTELSTSAFQINMVGKCKIFNLNNGDFLILQLLNVKDAVIAELSKETPDFSIKVEEKLIKLQSDIEQKLYEQELYNNAKIKLIQQIE